MRKKQQVLLFAQWHEHGERSTKYFLNFEKRNNVKKHISKLHASGAITTNPFKVLDEQKRFYHNLYNSKSTDMDCKIGETFLSNLNIPKLSEEQKQYCEGEIPLEEIKLIVLSHCVTYLGFLSSVALLAYIVWHCISSLVTARNHGIALAM